MNENSIQTYYLDFIEKETQCYSDATRCNVYDFSKLIIDYIINYDEVSSLKELDYAMIKNIVKSNDIENIQYSLHLLSLKPYDVLKWIFYVEDSDNHYESERYYFKSKEMSEILQKKDFYNPLTGNSVTKLEFSELVNTVFQVSDSFISKLPKHGFEDSL